MQPYCSGGKFAICSQREVYSYIVEADHNNSEIITTMQSLNNLTGNITCYIQQNDGQFEVKDTNYGITGIIVCSVMCGISVFMLIFTILVYIIFYIRIREAPPF